MYAYSNNKNELKKPGDVKAFYILEKKIKAWFPSWRIKAKLDRISKKKLDVKFVH